MSGNPLEKLISRRKFITCAGAAATGAALSSCGLRNAASPSSTMAPLEPVGPSPEAYWSAVAYDEWIDLGVRSSEAFLLRIITTRDIESEDGAAAWDYVLSEWSKMYPDAIIQHATVDPSELETATIDNAGGRLPLDIGWSPASSVANLAALGIIVPLNELMPQWYWDTRLEALTKSPTAGAGPEESFLAPVAMESAAHIFRKDIWQEAGVDLDGIKTWDDLLAACETLRENSDFSHPVAFYLASPGSAVDTTQWIFYGNGLQHEADFSDREAYLECITFMQELFEYVPRASLGWDWAQGRQAYLSGKAAMLAHDGIGLIDARDQDSADVFNRDRTIARPFAGGPGNPLGEPFYRFNPICYVLMEATAHPQAVADYIACATTSEAALKLGPATIPPTNDWTLDRRVETSSLGEGIGWWFEQWQDIHRGAGAWAASGYPARAEVIPFFRQQVAGLLRGETTPEGVLQALEGFAVPLIQAAEETAA